MGEEPSIRLENRDLDENEVALRATNPFLGLRRSTIGWPEASRRANAVDFPTTSRHPSHWTGRTRRWTDLVEFALGIL